MNKKGMFTGFKAVFSFTAGQAVKGKGFKATTIFLTIIFAVLFALAPVIMANSQLDSDNDSDIEEQVDYIDGISQVYILDNDVYKNIKNKDFYNSFLGSEGKLKVEVIDENKKDEVLKNDKKAVTVLFLKDGKEKNTYTADVYGNEENENNVSAYIDYLNSCFETKKYEYANVSPEKLQLLFMPFDSQSLTSNESEHYAGAVIAAVIIPMVFSLLMFMMINMYGQSITKSVMAEKSSKLMETLLTSVKPYALMAGKIVAMSAVGLVQFLVWLAGGILGYMAGCGIAENINPSYTNYVNVIIDAMRTGGNQSAFTVTSIILAICAVILGFLFYCVLAGLCAACISKAEDLSNSMALFQIPVIIGWMAAYLSPMAESDTFARVMDYIPLTSPFIVPADILTGEINTLFSLVAIIILAVSTGLLVLVTGKVYKGKLFNR